MQEGKGKNFMNSYKKTCYKIYQTFETTRQILSIIQINICYSHKNFNWFYTACLVSLKLHFNLINLFVKIGQVLLLRFQFLPVSLVGLLVLKEFDVDLLHKDKLCDVDLIHL